MKKAIIAVINNDYKQYAYFIMIEKNRHYQYEWICYDIDVGKYQKISFNKYCRLKKLWSK
jgi:hypothetical protein